MSKRMWYLVLAVVIVIVGGYLTYSATPGVKDRAAWSRFRTELTAEKVSKIEFGAVGKPPMAIADADKPAVLAALQQAAFDHANPNREGPTPGAVLSLVFTDGRQVNLGMLSMQSFELQPEPGSQFLIKADQLGVWLRNHFQSPSMG
jgi:hypothetical protein